MQLSNLLAAIAMMLCLAVAAPVAEPVAEAEVEGRDRPYYCLYDGHTQQC